MNRFNSHRIASIGILSALSLVILFAVPKFPIFGAVPFLEMDFADIPIFIATFMYGPWIGLAITFVVCLIQGITISAFAGIMGILMHFVATGSFVLVAGLIYKRMHTFKGAVIAECVGVVTWVIMMVPFNLVITPLFMGGYDVAFQQVVSLLPFIVAFNVIKSSVNAAVTLLLYKNTHRLFNTVFDKIDHKIDEKHNKNDVEADVDDDTTTPQPVDDDVDTSDKTEE